MWEVRTASPGSGGTDSCRCAEEITQAGLYAASGDDVHAGSTNTQCGPSSWEAHSRAHLQQITLCKSMLLNSKSNPSQSCLLQHFSVLLVKHFWDSAIAQMIHWQSRQRQIPPEAFSDNPSMTIVAFKCSVTQN